MSDPITRLNAALEGRYHIERELGEGGMATVYLADDLRHERKVALKVLKPELAAVVGAERFLAEIKTTANLQHPHILPLFDSGEADGFLFYVMPYVEGESLRDRLDREKQLPVDEAVRIATDVAEALRVAHEQGVIHRDVKPANILLSRGRPLVADFGIALAVSAAGGGRLTETGLSMGTPYYMSPEQASADREPTAASDVYSLGCVLYEMLVGEPPHTGGTAQAVLAKILMDEVPAPTKTRASIPANVDAAIRKALEKLPADRFTGANGFAKALADPGFRHGAVAGVGAAGAGSPWNRLAVAFASLFLLASGVAAWALVRAPAEPARPIERFADPFLEGQEHSGYTGYAGSDLSPDGTMLVYRYNGPDGQVLMLRRWDDLAAAPIRETSGALAPAVSLDGLELAFQQEGEIKVLAFAGGPVRTLLTGTQPEWGPDGYVYATTDSGSARVPSTGGAVETLSRLADGETSQFVRDVLSDGRHALLEIVRSDGSAEIRGLDLRTGEMKPLVEGQNPRYARTGHLVYYLDGTLMAVRFDLRRMQVLGTPIAVVDGITYFSLADDGKLYYVVGRPGTAALGRVEHLAWVTRSGVATPVDPAWTFNGGADPFEGWSLSPDGSSVAVREYAQAGYDIWIKRLDTGPRSRLTFDPAEDKMPAWDPDGRNVTFLSNRKGDGGFDVWTKPADGTGQPQLLLDLDVDLKRVSWTPDGTWLLLWTAGDDILGYRPGVDREPTPLLAESYAEGEPAVSPDGRWIAYESNETGTPEIYVAPFPDVSSGRWQISSAGGRYPRWAHGRAELYFGANGPGGSLYVASFEAGSTFTFQDPVVLFQSPGSWVGTAQLDNPYEVAPDDERFLIARAGGATGGEAAPAARVVLEENFFEELKRVVP